MVATMGRTPPMAKRLSSKPMGGGRAAGFGLFDDDVHHERLTGFGSEPIIRADSARDASPAVR